MIVHQNSQEWIVNHHTSRVHRALARTEVAVLFWDNFRMTAIAFKVRQLCIYLPKGRHKVGTPNCWNRPQNWCCTIFTVIFFISSNNECVIYSINWGFDFCSWLNTLWTLWFCTMKMEIRLNKGGTGESRGCRMHNSSLDDSVTIGCHTERCSNSKSWPSSSIGCLITTLEQPENLLMYYLCQFSNVISFCRRRQYLKWQLLLILPIDH